MLLLDEKKNVRIICFAKQKQKSAKMIYVMTKFLNVIIEIFISAKIFIDI